MNVVVVIAELGTGGAEAVACDVALDLRRHGHEVTVVSAGGWREERLVQGGVRTERAPLRGRDPVSLTRSWWVLRRVLREADVVHAHNARAATLARRAASRRTPMVVTAHGFPRRARAAARLLARTRARVVAVSPETRDELVAGGLPQESVVVVDNAVSALPEHSRRVARARLGIDPGDRVVLCAARLMPEKRHDLLLEAWRRWPDPPLLLLAGDGPLRRRLAEGARSLGLGERVRMLGNREDVDWLLAACDALVLASDSEGLPVSVLEAMLARRPVVASAVGGLRSLDPGSITLFEPGSVPALLAALRAVLDDPEGAERQVGHGVQMVQERFSADRMLASYRGLITERER